MAKFKSIVTDSGVEALTALIASGQGLNLTRAAAGSGVPDVSPNTLSGLINPEDVTANLAGKEFVDGTPAIMRIPVQITNEALEANVWVREIGVFGQDINGKEILFCYGWLDGEDSDNVIPATSFEDGTEIHRVVCGPGELRSRTNCHQRPVPGAGSHRAGIQRPAVGCHDVGNGARCRSEHGKNH